MFRVYLCKQILPACGYLFAVAFEVSHFYQIDCSAGVRSVSHLFTNAQTVHELWKVIL